MVQPRLLDMDQCNDASSIQVAVVLGKAFEFKVNELPLSLTPGPGRECEICRSWKFEIESWRSGIG